MPKTKATAAAEDSEAVVRDGVRILPLRWSVGYGPDTTAWLLTPASGIGPWPGMLALHDHGGFRWYGKEKIADGPNGPDLLVAASGCRENYAGRAWANDLARSGMAVLVHDVLSWGSRRFTPADLEKAEGTFSTNEITNMGARCFTNEHIVAYNAIANQREHTLAKWCTMLGTSIPGLLAHEDHIALDVLRGRPECTGDIGCIGHSGGGARACVLAAYDGRIKAAVVSCMMTTYTGLLAHAAWLHTWQFFPPGWAPLHDWPDIISLRAGMPLMVSYGRHDKGFAPEAMRAADRKLQNAWRATGSGPYDHYWFDGGHRFGRDEQARATDWLQQHMTH